MIVAGLRMIMVVWCWVGHTGVTVVITVTMTSSHQCRRVQILQKTVVGKAGHCHDHRVCHRLLAIVQVTVTTDHGVDIVADHIVENCATVVRVRHHTKHVPPPKIIDKAQVGFLMGYYSVIVDHSPQSRIWDSLLNWIIYR